MSHNLIPAVRKLAVVRANAIGDFVFGLPAFDALRAAYPAAEIVLIGQQWHSDFLKGRPGPIDRVIVAPPYKGVTLPDRARDRASPGELERFFNHMVQERFDLAV